MLLAGLLVHRSLAQVKAAQLLSSSQSAEHVPTLIELTQGNVASTLQKVSFVKALKSN